MTEPENMNTRPAAASDAAKQPEGAGRARSYGMGRGPQVASGPVLQAAKAPVTPKVVPVQQQKKGRGAGFWIAIVIAVIAIIVACVLAFTMCGVGKSARQGDVGQLEGKSAEEIQAELDRKVEEGMFNISIASGIEFPNGASEGELRIENVPGNRYLMKVVIVRDDTGEQVYETDLIEPNHHIQRDKLKTPLPAGDYNCTATFYAYEPDTEELVGQAAAKVMVKVAS